jgi:integrase
MEKSMHRNALIQVAKRLEAIAQQGDLDFTIAPIPSPTEATELTPFGTYVSKVFIPRRSQKLAERTIDSWKQYLRLRILPAFGDVAIGAIKPGRLIDFFVGMQAEGLSYQTIGRYYAFLNVVFKMAAKTGVIPCNPMEKVDKPTPRKDELIEEGVKACTEAEISQLLEITKKEPLKWQVVIRLLVDTGMRCGECMALQWGDINWRTNEITIRSSLGYTGEKGKYLTTPKNRKVRKVYVSDETMALLMLHYADNCHGVKSKFINHQNKSPEPMHPHSPGAYLKKLAKRHDLSHIHPHKLRHSYASIAVTNGADISSVADNLGHSNSAFTLRVYTNANEKSKRNATKICLDAVKNATRL